MLMVDALYFRTHILQRSHQVLNSAGLALTALSLFRLSLSFGFSLRLCMPLFLER